MASPIVSIVRRPKKLATREEGALMVYAHGMGTVVRCPSCDAVVLFVARTSTHPWVDATGARRIVIPSMALPA